MVGEIWLLLPPIAGCHSCCSKGARSPADWATNRQERLNSHRVGRVRIGQPTYIHPNVNAALRSLLQERAKRRLASASMRNKG